MKKTLAVILLVAGGLVITLNDSCKKKDEDSALDAAVKQHNADANYYKGESDQADNDINNDLSNHPGMGRTAPGAAYPLSSPLCGVLIDTTQLSSKTIIYNFDGVTPCFSPSRTRGGQIKVQLTTGTSWATAGSVLTITYTNFKITRLYDKKSVTFNGVKTLKNINGNDWLGFVLSGKKLKYQERALNIAVNFDGGYSATWNVARMTEWSYVKADATIPYDRIAFSATGDTTVNGFNNVDSWGVNRYGKNFTTYYNSPLVSNTYCGLWRFNSGEVTLNINGSGFTITTGLNEAGSPTPYACAYGFKVSWVDSNGKSNSVILSY